MQRIAGEKAHTPDKVDDEFDIRKDLDDIATRTHRSVILCRRVFDNLKRITKRVEDAEGNPIQMIMTHFLLSQDLASQYVHIIFINHYRLDTTKRKMAGLGYADYEYGTFCFLIQLHLSFLNILQHLQHLL
jgi:hypothetical protein